MTLALASTVASCSLAAYLDAAELVASTSATARATVVDEEVIRRSYMGSPTWGFALEGGQTIRGLTAVSEQAPLLVGPERIEDPVIAQLIEFEALNEGWDGEDAAKPQAAAIREAVRFLRAVGDAAPALDPTLHVDGSVILEIEDGEAGSLRFKGDGTVIYALGRAGRGIVPFDGFSVPEEIRPALGA